MNMPRIKANRTRNWSNFCRNQAMMLPKDIQQRLQDFACNCDLRKNPEILRLSKVTSKSVDPKGAMSEAILQEVNRNGYAIVSGLPIDPRPVATPIFKLEEKPESNFITEKSLLYLSTIFGKPHAYESENKGQYIHDLYPIKGNEHIASGTGSEMGLELHTEIAFDSNKPDYLILTAVRTRKEQNVPTKLVNIASVLSRLSEAELHTLQENIYFIRAPYSFSGCDEVYYRKALIDSVDRKCYSFNFNPGVTYCGTVESKKIFSKIKALFDQNAFDVYLSPGSALIIDNNQMLHGRSLFKPQFDGKDRWLQRMYVQGY